MSKKPPKVSSMAFTFFIFVILLKLSNVDSTHNLTNLFKAVLVFGDSTADSGNNNYISTTFKADHRPYGLDFPGGIPTGRFSNGKLVPDFWVSLLGIKQTIPPYLKPNLSNYQIRTGVNFASAGSGYDGVTARVSGVIPMTKQLNYFKEYIKRLKKVVGLKEAKSIVKGALVSISAGTNDFTISYYDLRTRRDDFAIGGYQDFVLKKLQNFTRELYRLGCRTMVVSGLPPMGCLPIQMASRFTRTCLKEQNFDARIYNQKLKKMLPRIQSSLAGSRIMYADIYTPLMEMIHNPQNYGFTQTKIGCCGLGFLEAGPICTPFTPLCTNPSNHLFFDSIHPSEAAYRHVTKTLLKQIIRYMNNSGHSF
ncbi:putative triacylglycerol lipase [Helianthus annuus]|uniref:Putative GDSL-like Lipase/Acylhydrolase family protein n=2 Tax=Helianthus annuus TaxID=4232 RepID=A0A251ULS3_HELAN|nr:putative triacylglycerol lipase [Helianthus annuus]KAJ0501739.1 putative triacylglycerol lipase [Helianthus annuus]KAJ0509634.1 putative triacylglycerol lipase [Helianthus annuus]KAJ0517661.1 putative triacylglycerol lipase [Helianthus annuus]KAJ0685678.1 putative triacylglycerol lipase [Helianthus annuus]